MTKIRRAAIGAGILAVFLISCTAIESGPNRTTLPPDSPPPFRDSVGTGERVCVDVDPLVDEARASGKPVLDVRSGDFVAGNFAQIVGSWSSFDDGDAKIYWIPISPDLPAQTNLDIVIEPIDEAKSASEMTFGTRVEAESGDYLFWATTPNFDNPGRYRITAMARDHWGCFEFTV